MNEKAIEAAAREIQRGSGHVVSADEARTIARAALAAAIPLHQHPTDRCMICGLVVDLRFEAIKPTVDLSPGATNRNRKVGLPLEDAEKMVADFEDAVLDCERNDSTVINRNELDATRAVLRDALIAEERGLTSQDRGGKP